MTFIVSQIATFDPNKRIYSGIEEDERDLLARQETRHVWSI